MPPDSDPPPVAASWDAYWQGSGDAGAYSSGGVNHPAILSFWDECFAAMQQAYSGDPAQKTPGPKILDIASGNGAVIERALAIFANDRPAITCLDASDAAVTNIRNRFPGIDGLVADAGSIPLDSGGFDAVTSQFGVEYAGLKAIGEAARLVAPGGRLTLLLHNQASSIHRECAASLDAIKRLQASGFIPHAIEMLTAGFAACRGADRAPYDEAATRLVPAVQTLDAIMTEHGEQVAGDTIARLYSDVDRIHSRMQHYQPEEVLGWLNRMDSELEAYAQRMSSMCRSAISSETFDQVCADLCRQGFTLQRAESLAGSEDGLPLAWVLIADNKLADEVAVTVDEPQSQNLPANADNEQRAEVRPWIKRLLGAAVYELADRGIVDSPFVETKPVWAAPYQALLGKIRPYADAEKFIWVICGELPTDHLDGSVARTPRDAARHFAIKWQLDAARQQDAEEPQQRLSDSELANKAEALYALVNDEEVWQQQSGL
ncbi:MAG: DUF4826 family protein [Gammaproteobacteria bacterium]|jgi:ubiquinone/menaquinone biosynthesis C-methylase UbiE|nr:hypothetical protein [Chromatiales bacterium]MDP7153167.1 DUF4826 family protein [Gammaproteobacteria bacterium]MDP7295825.1 DUF4826 family protein [Gammaproteobacteria bacterium]MDP7419420.1 DUF4826 family protein [Gammaproteobacteria bacterium]MDP7659705.1 DUF4826 family protein [Gammaproteobacteria bacterium]